MQFNCRKMEILEQKIAWLKKERDQFFSHMKDGLKWRRKIELQLFDLKSGFVNEEDGNTNGNTINTEFGDMISRRSRNVWRTARQFFTAEESQFFLASTKVND